jgi:ribosomal protein S12 methylthiotransferase accessory factor
MDIRIDFPGGDRVVARFGDYVVVTDQDGSAPSPFELFLSSIGTCAGIYVSRFCRERGIPTDGLGIEMRTETDSITRLVRRIDLDVILPPGFPDSYRAAVLRSAQLCAVKKHLEHPPEFHLRTLAPEQPVGSGA